MLSYRAHIAYRSPGITYRGILCAAAGSRQSLIVRSIGRAWRVHKRRRSGA